jgi:hypothetical protein
MSKLRSGLRNDRRRYKCCNSISVRIVSGQSSFYEGLEQVDITSLYDASDGIGTYTGGLDDGDVPIPTNFNFFGQTSNVYWSSNNAIIFGTPNPHLEANIPRNQPAILIGNYDRALKAFYYKNIVTTNYSMTIVQVEFYDYYTNTTSDPTYQYQIRLIKTTTGQYVEVYVKSSPPSPGYSTANITYPSGVDANGNPEDSNGNTIDSTKHSPYNITNGTNFLNLCGTYSTSSPAANTSFVFSSDSTGTTWAFHNNSYVSV